MSEQDILNAKKRVEIAANKVAERTGQLNTLMAQINNEFNCDSLNSAEVVLKKSDETILELDSDIQELIDEIQTKYGLL